MRSLLLYAMMLPVFLIVDLIWLGVIMKSFYSAEMGDLAKRAGEAIAPRWGAAALVYLLIPAGIVLFVRPLLSGESSVWQALGWGGLFGFVLYGVYDLTNRAVLEKWSLRLTLADILWGVVLCGTMSAVMYGLDRWLNR